MQKNLKTSILIVPSIWQEPFALTALEGVCNGAAVIASKVGGMQEMLEDVGMLINDIDAIKLEKSILSLLENEKTMLEGATKYIQTFKDIPYIFNLGHGVLPETNPEMVKCLVQTVKEYK